MAILLFLITFAISPLAAADWGLGAEFIVSSCQIKTVGKCEKFRGRSNQTNGSAAVEIWKVGTKRIVAWGSATKAANDSIKKKLDFHHILYGDFVACPMEKDIPGHRIHYCVEKVDNMHWVQVD